MNDIDDMQAGREMDKTIGRRVFFWNRILGEDGFYCPDFSTDISKAWRVVEKLGLSVIKTKSGYFAGIYDLEDEYLDEKNGIIDGHFNSNSYAEADTAPLAICRAALKAVLKKA